ncbi:hypothetical protein CY0110_17567 [Crocosphaera chwakensis CCY0110]|uniref:Uncharacterized protein n=1 Tax=Crocosphaera chwakensis CCY0110 TaxID=391612 RepID=A3IIJ5_9CHRO|nr:hypothetical protein CY0110_17567 [Crocosphaera chwakensis CCY0110]
MECFGIIPKRKIYQNFCMII